MTGKQDTGNPARLPLAEREPRAFASPISSDLPRTRNIHPIGLTSNAHRYRRLETYPNQDALKWQVRDGLVRVFIEVIHLPAYLLIGKPYDGQEPEGQPFLVEGYWCLDSRDAFDVLRHGEMFPICCLCPSDSAELHREWPDFFPEQEFYLHPIDWLRVRRADLFWTNPIEPVCSPAVPQDVAIAPAATRQIALVEAEDAALATLRKELKREPDFEEFWRYITERDDTGTISDHTDDRLIWTGKDGRNCETAKSTMRNRLKEARKRNPFNL